MGTTPNIRAWDHFLTIAAAGSMTQAAAQLRIAQPVLSREMAELERQLGAKLLRRHARGVRLTSAGDIFKTRAQQVLEAVRAVGRDLDLEHHVPTGTLSVGMPPSMSAFITANVVKEYRAMYPNVKMNVVSAPSDECYELLVDRRIDIAVIANRRGHRGIDVVPLISESLFVAGTRDLLVDLPDCIDICQLARLPLTMSSPPNLFHDLVGDELTRRGLRLNLVLEGNSWSILDFARKGLAVTVAAECAKGGFFPDSVRFIEIEGIRVNWSIATLAYRPTTPAAEAYASVVHQIVSDRINSGLWSTASLERV
jgi:LysR family nitrogen assimilation transcriptional regulator